MQRPLRAQRITILAFLILAVVAAALPTHAASASRQTFYLGTAPTVSMQSPNGTDSSATVGNQDDMQNLRDGTVTGVGQAYWQHTLTAAGTFQPRSFDIFLHVSAPVAVTPVYSGADAICPVEAYIGLHHAGSTKGYWWYCDDPSGGTAAILPGDYELTGSWSDNDAIQVAAGDDVYFSVWSTSTSTASDTGSTMSILSGSSAHPSHFVLEGTNEPGPTPASGSTTTAAPIATTSQPAPTTTSPPPSSPAPQPTGVRITSAAPTTSTAPTTPPATTTHNSPAAALPVIILVLAATCLRRRAV